MAVVPQKEIDKAFGFLNERLESINRHYIEKMAQHVYSIGHLTASDINELQQMRLMSKNMSEIYREIAQLANISEDELMEAFERSISLSDYKPYVRDVLSNVSLDFRNNAALRRVLESQVKITHGQIANFASTTVFSEPYYRAVDKGILAIRSGVADYNTMIRGVIREAAGMGLRVRESDNARVVDYASGYSRRLDSAVRQNVLDGLRDVNQECYNLLGEQLGMDGVEIDAHFLCAEDHLPYQGMQYSYDEFDDIQSGLQRPFGYWNCKHQWIHIKLGASPPAYTQDDLRQMREYSEEEITINNSKGEPITKSRYQWSQEQRRLETAMRQQADIKAAASVKGGDPVLARQADVNIYNYQKAYEQIHAATGITTRYEATPLANGYKYPEGIERMAAEESGKTEGNNSFHIVDGIDMTYDFRPRDGMFDYVIEDVVNAQGFDGVPRIVNGDEFDEFVKESNFIAQRTYSADSIERLDDYKNMLYNGKWYIDCENGGAQYGQGMYCAADYNGVLSTGIEQEMRHYINLNTKRGNEFANVETLTLDSSAKIIKYDDAFRLLNDYRTNFTRKYLVQETEGFSEVEMIIAKRELRFWKDGDDTVAITREARRLERTLPDGEYDKIASKAYAAKSRVEAMWNDWGRRIDVGGIAALHGYDAINAVGHGQSGSYTVILNRTKVIFRRDELG